MDSICRRGFLKTSAVAAMLGASQIARAGEGNGASNQPVSMADSATSTGASFHDNVKYLQERAAYILDTCMIETETMYEGSPKKQRVMIPCGGGKYPSVWIRDCAMNSECGLVDAPTMKRHIGIIASYGQNGDADLHLENKLVVPKWAVADHVNYNAKPVYFAGTYSDGKDQGNGAFGFYPPHDDNYYFIAFIDTYIALTGDSAILGEVYAGMPLADRLEKAWEGYHIDKETDLCTSSMPDYTVDWGFCDMVQKSGLLLFPSILRCTAAQAMARMLKGDKAEYYRRKAETIARNIERVFFDPSSGWFYSATEICHQYDVWGTIYAIYMNILSEPVQKKCLEAVARSYLDGTTVANGYVRQIRTCDDKPNTAWERSTIAYMTYQNGGYWASASGWMFYALAKYDLSLSKRMVDEFVVHTKKYAHDGAPYEWINKDTSGITDGNGRLAGTCATLPYEGARRIAKELLPASENG